ncbi:MAG: hypothetical protein IPL46_08845 [Saprospiraceae bacterium]|nr:hypothetical protein [Saprospiraceae bacterium]
MIKPATALILILCVTSLSCRKRDPVLFEIPFRLNFEIPAGLNPFERHYFRIANVSTNIETLREQFNVAPDHVLRIRPASAIFSSLLQDIDFEFIQEIGISVYQGLNQDEASDVFLTDFIPVNAGRNVNILPFEDDVADVMNVKNINFLVSIRLRAPTPVFISSNIDVKFIAE